MADASTEDLEQFLTKIDDIHRLVQNLSSDDSNDVSKAMEESDVLLKEVSKTGVDRTVINKTSSSEQEQISPNAFMSAMEKDAAERAENRRKNKLRADELKTKGNDAFHQQLYDQAIDYYTQGLKIKKDYDILYTNRAQVYVKQGRYHEAISDCEWALKVTPTLIKAFVMRGKCWIHLKEFDRAQEEFRQAEEMASKNHESMNTRRMIEECLEDVQRQREISHREESAKIFLANEDSSTPMNLSNTLKKLSIDEQPIIYYIGGIDLLCQLIKDETIRTAFRVNDGFDLFNSRLMFTRVEDENLAESMFHLMINLAEDQENARQSLDSQFLKNYLTKTVYSTTALQYLVEISLKTQLRSILIQKINVNGLIECLLNIINAKQASRVFAAKLLSNLAVESKIKQCLNHPNELNKLISILKSSSNDEPLRNVIFSLFTNLCSEKNIRLYILDHTEILPILLEDLEGNSKECQLNLLGLLINLTSDKSNALQEISKKLGEILLVKLRNSSHHHRIFTLVGNLVMHDEQVVGILIQYKAIPWISQTVQEHPNEELIRATMRLIALCTQANEQVQQAIANDQKLLSLIYEQLLNSENSLLIGNASLVFGHVIIHPPARTFLRKRSGIEKTMAQMLKLVDEPWLTKPARKNVAIFLTKMVKTDENFLQEFRNQHGTEILHSALKDVEL